MSTSGSQLSDLEIRSLLGCFLFSGDDVDKKIKVLSGGEKARVALAKVITSRANFLLLDEPTNHLDLHSCELLIEALHKYEGTIILVSHDRYFISKTANKIWEIEKGIVKEFKGGYDEWVSWKERMEKQRTTASKKPVLPEKSVATVTQTAPTQQISKEKKKEVQRTQKLFQQAEKELADATVIQKELEKKLADPSFYSNKEEFLKLEAAYQNCLKNIKFLTANYEKLFEEMMQLGE
jgi:ATP-binding cassette subfamily F protein 3